MLEAALVALVVTLTLEPVVIHWLTRRAVFDYPDHRSNHTIPTPRGGGAAVVMGVLAGVTVAQDSTALALSSTILIAAAVGAIEDVRGMQIVPRLVATMIAGLALSIVVIRLGLPPDLAGVMIVLIGVPWTLSVVNAVNFMDGINGISMALAVVGGLAYAVLGQFIDSASLIVLGVVVAAAGLGFAPYNVPRARVFLGDVGSYGLGASFAAMSLLALATGVPVEAAVAPLALYLADTGMTIMRRAQAGQPWHLPHKEHVYQRLVALGLSHIRVSMAAGTLMALCAALGLVSLSGSLALRAVADIALLVVLGAYLASPRLLAARMVVHS